MSNSYFGTEVEQLLAELNNNSQLLTPKLIRKLNESVWLTEAKALINNYINDLNRIKLVGVGQTKTPELIIKTQISVIQVRQLNQILKCFHLLTPENKDGYIDKLVKALNMPLLMEEENSDLGTQQGRDFLFELKVLTKFVYSGYRVIVKGQHPDLSIYIGNQKYAVECKRIYKESAFKNSIERAIQQLKTESFNKDKDALGIVALNFSRFFNPSEIELLNPSNADVKLLEYYRQFQQRTFNIFDKIEVPKKVRYFFFEFDRYVFMGNTIQEITFMDIFDPELVKGFKKLRDSYIYSN